MSYFLVYSKPGCPWCSLVKADLKAAGHEVTDHLITDPAERESLNRNYGTATYPKVILVSDGSADRRAFEFIGGYEATMAHIGKVPA